MSENYLTIDLSKLSGQATFSKKTEMDEQIYKYIEQLRSNESPESVIDILLFLGRSSLRILGVSFAKYQTIADAIGKSKRTVIRAINKLEEAGMIERIPTLRKWLNSRGGKSRKRSVNIIRILPLASQGGTLTKTGKPCDDEGLTDSETVEPSESNQPQKHLLDTEKASVQMLKSSIPKVIYETMSPFYNLSDLYDIIGALYRAKASVDNYIRVEEHGEYMDAFLGCIRRHKAGKVRNLKSYLYRTWVRVSTLIKLREMASIYN